MLPTPCESIIPTSWNGCPEVYTRCSEPMRHVEIHQSCCIFLSKDRHCLSRRAHSTDRGSFSTGLYPVHFLGSKAVAVCCFSFGSDRPKLQKTYSSSNCLAIQYISISILCICIYHTYLNFLFLFNTSFRILKRNSLGQDTLHPKLQRDFRICAVRKETTEKVKSNTALG